MSKFLIVTNRAENWKPTHPQATTVTARQYLTDPQFAVMRGVRVINLCRSLAYQTSGYYVSLLAEARGHKPLPRITTIQDVKSASIIRSASSELDELAEKTLGHLDGKNFELAIYFSRGVHKHYDQLCRQIFNTFPAPLLRATFRKNDGDGWELRNISTISLQDVPGEHVPALHDRAREFLQRATTSPRDATTWPYSGIKTTATAPRMKKPSSASHAPPKNSPWTRKSLTATTSGASASLTHCLSAPPPR